MDSSFLKDELTCSICFDLMRPMPNPRNPRALSCSHTFCAACLQRIEKKSSFRCPNCNQITTSNSVDSLPINSILVRLMDAMNITSEDYPTCDNCGKKSNKIVGKCFDCSTSLCEVCYVYHENMKVFHNHKVFTGDLVNSITLPKRPIDDATVCELHKDEKLKFYCETCDMFICRDCILLQHKTHNFQLISDVYVKKLAHLKGELNEAVESINSTMTHIASAKTNLNEMNIFIEETEGKMNALFDEVCALVETRRRKALASVRPFITKYDIYSKYIAEVSVGVQELQESSNTIRQAIDSSSAIEILTEYKSYMQKLNKLRRFKPFGVVNLESFQLHPNPLPPLPALYVSVNHIGRLTYEGTMPSAADLCDDIVDSDLREYFEDEDGSY